MLRLFSPVLPCFRFGTFDHVPTLKGNWILPCGVQWQALDLNILARVASSVAVIFISTPPNSNKLSPKLRLNFLRQQNLLLNQQLATQAHPTSSTNYASSSTAHFVSGFSNCPTASSTIHFSSATFHIHRSPPAAPPQAASTSPQSPTTANAG